MLLLLILLSLHTDARVVKLNIITEGYAVYLNATTEESINVTGAPYDIFQRGDTTELTINSRLAGLLPMFGLPLKVLTIRVPEGSIIVLDAQIDGGKSEFNLDKLKLSRLNLISSRSRNIIKFGYQKNTPVSGVVSVYLGYIRLIDMGQVKSIDLSVSLNMSGAQVFFGKNARTLRGTMAIQGTFSRVIFNTSDADISVTKHGLIRVEGYRETKRPATLQINLLGTLSMYKLTTR